MITIQWIGLIFTGVITYHSFILYKKKIINIIEISCFFVMSFIASLIIIFPLILSPLVKGLELTRTFDLIIMSLFFVLIFYTFNLIVKTSSMNKQIKNILENVRKNTI